MKNSSTSPRPKAQTMRSWTPPKLSRLEGGRAELTKGPNQDASNFS
jgi:hypothetical protein